VILSHFLSVPWLFHYWLAYLASEGVDASRNNPRDLGSSRDYTGQKFTYCLKCGKWKIASAPLSQCDDSVHMTTRNFG